MHDGGYRDGGGSILENFQAGRYFGVPLPKLYDMCVDPHSRNANPSTAPYPHMSCWLR